MVKQSTKSLMLTVLAVVMAISLAFGVFSFSPQSASAASVTSGTINMTSASATSGSGKIGHYSGIYYGRDGGSVSFNASSGVQANTKSGFYFKTDEEFTVQFSFVSTSSKAITIKLYTATQTAYDAVVASQSANNTSAKSHLSTTYSTVHLDVTTTLTTSGYTTEAVTIPAGYYALLITNSNSANYLKSITFTPAQTTPKYTVTFDENGGSTVEDKTVDEGSTITLPSTSKAGYTFAGWSDGTNTYQAGTTYTVNAAATLTAQWTANTYTVSFDANGGVASDTSLSWKTGETIPALPTAELDGYTFLGWYLDGVKVEEITTELNGETLVADWQEIKDEYNVIFYSNGDVWFEDVVQANTAYGAIANPSLDGYRFDGWYLEGEETAYDFSTLVNQDLELIAKWVEQVTVSFSDSFDSVTFDIGAKVANPGAASKEGYEFVAWTLNGSAYNFDSAVNEDITLVASWNVVISNVAIDADASYVIYPTEGLTLPTTAIATTVEGNVNLSVSASSYNNKNGEAQNVTLTAAIPSGYVLAEGVSVTETTSVRFIQSTGIYEEYAGSWTKPAYGTNWAEGDFPAAAVTDDNRITADINVIDNDGIVLTAHKNMAYCLPQNANPSQGSYIGLNCKNNETNNYMTLTLPEGTFSVQIWWSGYNSGDRTITINGTGKTANAALSGATSETAYNSLTGGTDDPWTLTGGTSYEITASNKTYIHKIVITGSNSVKGSGFVLKAGDSLERLTVSAPEGYESLGWINSNYEVVTEATADGEYYQVIAKTSVVDGASILLSTSSKNVGIRFIGQFEVNSDLIASEVIHAFEKSFDLTISADGGNSVTKTFATEKFSKDIRTSTIKFTVTIKGEAGDMATKAITATVNGTSTTRVAKDVASEYISLYGEDLTEAQLSALKTAYGIA